MARKSEEESEQGEEVEEDEALSLSDLPLDFINEETSLLRACEEATTLTQGKENEEEFNFDSWGGPLSAESEMCAADEVFFKGQILPLRLSRLRELKIKKKSKEKQQGKQAMSRHRTFEWLKELSHASYVDAHSVQ
ncbi:hypothetical protein CUMW_124940 [Citrus unshiu]|nr:hypothetical protein CUMW_124940 [Citrus unshiu]